MLKSFWLCAKVVSSKINFKSNFRIRSEKNSSFVVGAVQMIEIDISHRIPEFVFVERVALSHLGSQRAAHAPLARVGRVVGHPAGASVRVLTVGKFFLMVWTSLALLFW